MKFWKPEKTGVAGVAVWQFFIHSFKTVSYCLNSATPTAIFRCGKVWQIPAGATPNQVWQNRPQVWQVSAVNRCQSNGLSLTATLPHLPHLFFAERLFSFAAFFQEARP
ncbi:MAG: hypothetical protein JNK95_07495 [Candidatus Competibacter sp.]|nr:hypothetical protein [Candidatus Competibacter sp.]MDG4604910.1 hypothetical protein [Candidatus Contendobacter sp.]HRD50773.1 hypothetical protein [Candidatus Contendobacter sp.]